MNNYVGMKVLIQTNEQESDLIPAVIDGYDMLGYSGDMKVIRYKRQDNGEQFYFNGGTVYPDTEDFRSLFAFIVNRFPDVKTRWNFLREMKNFSSDMKILI